jgi:hypothetical protein
LAQMGENRGRVWALEKELRLLLVMETPEE